jgi:hypothetical protein
MPQQMIGMFPSLMEYITTSVMGNHGVGCSPNHKRYGITDKHYYAYIRPDLSNQWYISIILIISGYLHEGWA